MYEKLTQCPNCLSQDIRNHIICQDYVVSGESFAITRCANCGFLFTNPRPSLDNLHKYYESEQYKPHHNTKTSVFDLVYRFIRSYNFRYKHRIIKTHIPEPGNVLDIGTGTGEFLNFLKKKNWTIEGVEPNHTARQSASALTSGPIHGDLKEIKPNRQYHLITLWHVLEHLPDLNDTLAFLKKAKAKKGRILIAVPNFLSYDANHYGEHWAGYDVPRHLYHFSPAVMKAFLKKHKLKIIEQRPLIFDAYYVSLLSEKYLTGNRNILKAFTVGKKSNNQAQKDGNYSSLIYVVK
jgi:2-polyprenyl-3-methyl-5-hydroxy-6-metoxy-1,4-benzoquinol methylase